MLKIEVKVLPAHAGMVPGPGHLPVPRPSAPRARGGRRGSPVHHIREADRLAVALTGAAVAACSHGVGGDGSPS
ncbi:hypothetical protein SHJG_p1063 (plasmid) [Streptomyces hygroscopicus subsp. jinggangensis 5008]|nr:hypothetical protein SHJG_p1063 [Streptomyces hygroscopicus subsp. jinggangensis 5008]AGF68348.1 hypothetical protein SHJGH_p1063 [Streptomyces hygroscopicus subsp. jinggangensis TL01]